MSVTHATEYNDRMRNYLLATLIAIIISLFLSLSYKIRSPYVWKIVVIGYHTNLILRIQAYYPTWIAHERWEVS